MHMYLDTKTELFIRLAKVNNRNNEYALYTPTFFSQIKWLTWIFAFNSDSFYFPQRCFILEILEILKTFIHIY